MHAIKTCVLSPDPGCWLNRRSAMELELFLLYSQAEIYQLYHFLRKSFSIKKEITKRTERTIPKLFLGEKEREKLEQWTMRAKTLHAPA
jgi:hypothetical protein